MIIIMGCDLILTCGVYLFSISPVKLASSVVLVMGSFTAVLLNATGRFLGEGRSLQCFWFYLEILCSLYLVSRALFYPLALVEGDISPLQLVVVGSRGVFLTIMLVDLSYHTLSGLVVLFQPSELEVQCSPSEFLDLDFDRVRVLR